MNIQEKEEEGTLYESGRVVVQARAIVAVLNGILDCLPSDARAVAMARAQQALSDDPGAQKILEAGLHIERRAYAKPESIDA